MTEAGDSVEPDSVPQPGLWARCRADMQARLDGIVEFIGAIIFAIGGWRKVFFAISLSCLAGGLGLSIEQGYFSTGHRWLSVGGLVLGLILPFPRTEKRH